MEKRKWPTPRLSFMVMSSIQSVESGKGSPRVKSPSKLREPVDETSMPVTTTTTVT